MERLKQLLKKYWNLLLSKTTIDEQIVEAVEETKTRVKNVKAELKEVKDSIKEVANQAEDVVEAAKGKKRRGRKPKNPVKK